MDTVKNDVRVNVDVSELQVQEAASPPPVGGPRQKSKFPGDLQRRKRDSEKFPGMKIKKAII